MGYDLVIKNARVVDGTGRPSFKADIGVSGDTIALVGRISDTNGAQVIDATGKVVSPGFIEIHTHYDPQLCWDRTASPAGENGVTTVIMGNCGLSLAPVRPGFSGRVTKMFNKIEDIDTKFFDAAVPYSWQTFPEYLDYIRSGLGVNVAPVVGHSILRHYVMGEAAQQRAATDDEIAQMCAVLKEAIEAGAFGLSMSYPHLTDENDDPMASGFADIKERIALARTLVEGGRLYLQATLHPVDLPTKLHEYDELGRISLESGASCTALALVDAPYQASGFYQAELDKLAEHQANGSRLYAQTSARPFSVSFRLTKVLSLLYMVPVWANIMLKPVPERKELLRDRAIWPQLNADLLKFVEGNDVIGKFEVKETVAPANEKYLGRFLREIAESEDITSIEAMLRIAETDDFETLFESLEFINGDVDIVSAFLDHPLIQSGSSDAGAHVVQFAGEGDVPFMLKHFVRDHKKFTLERLVQRMTSDLARDFGIARRGSILPGNFADLVIFDPDTIDRGPEIRISDLPGGGDRLIRRPTGIDHVIVNGEVFVNGATYTNARAGRVI